MRITLHLLAHSLTLLSSLPLPAQFLKCTERKAEKTFASGNYQAALPLNRALLGKDSLRTDALFRAGESAWHLGRFDLAETYLEHIPDSSKTDAYEAVDYRIANAKKELMKYDEATRYYRKFILEHPNLEALVFQAKKELILAEWATQMRQNPQPVKIFRLGENINSVYFDGAPLRYADKLYFTSARPVGKTSPGLSRLYTSIQQGPSRLHEINPSQAEVQTGQIALTPDAGRLYYTLCRDGENGKTLCEIYYRERTYEGDWQAPKKLPGHVNMKGYTATQPATGRDRTLGKDVLFFSSDRPGGKGGMDIWCSVVERNGEFGEPFPLPFNTAGDEVTPFFHMQSQTLFFSSNGLQSFGGFDIFKTKRKDKENWLDPENMGWPLNSGSDDLYYSYHTGSARAYFASNRPGVLCADPEKGCNETDIFEARTLEDMSNWFNSSLDGFSVPAQRIGLSFCKEED